MILAKDISLNELKIMLENKIMISSKIYYDENGYFITFLNSKKTNYVLVKDKERNTPKTYKSVDRLIGLMKEMGYSNNFELCFNEKQVKSDELSDFKYFLLNKVTHVLDDIETHVKYGQDFNYEKDFKQVESLVKNLESFIKSYGSKSDE